MLKRVQHDENSSKVSARSVLRHPDRLGQVQPTVIQCPPGDHALDAIRDVWQQRMDITQVGDAARSDNRDRHGAGQRHCRFNIAALEQAIAADIGEEERGDAGILESVGEIGDGDGGDVRPTLGRDETVAGIDADDDRNRGLSAQRCQ